MGGLATILEYLPAVVDLIRTGVSVYDKVSGGNDDGLSEQLPVIVSSIGTGADLLRDLQAIAAKGNAITDEDLAGFAERMEAALAASQEALR